MRREEKILNIFSWMHVMIFLSSVYLLIPALLGQEGEKTMYLLKDALLLVIPVAVSFYMQRGIKNLMLYILGATLITASLFILTKQYITATCSLVIFLARGSTRIKKGKIKRQMREFPGAAGRFYEPEDWEVPTFFDRPGLLHLILFVLEYILMIFTGHHRYLTGMFGLLFAEVMIYFVYRYIFNMKDYVKGKAKIANLPGKTILRNGYVILAGLMVLLGCLLLPSILYGEEPLKRLYHKVEWHESVPVFEEILEMGDVQGMEEMLLEFSGEQSLPPAWLSKLSDFFVGTVMILLLAAFLLLAGKLARRLYTSFQEGEIDEIIDLKTQAEEQKHLQKLKRREERQMRNTPDAKIRKKYKKQILRSKKWKPHGFETPFELEENAELSGIADRKLFHELYEKARYSENGCTSREEENYPC